MYMERQNNGSKIQYFLYMLYLRNFIVKQLHVHVGEHTMKTNQICSTVFFQISRTPPS